MSSFVGNAEGDNSSTPVSEGGSTVHISRRQQVMMKLEAKKREEEMNATFKPDLALTSKSKHRNSTPTKVGNAESSAFDRLYNSSAARNSNKVVQADQETSFKPTLYTARSNSAQKVRSKASDVDVATRLYTSKGAGRRESSSAPEEKPSFSPQITKRAKSIERSRTISSSDRLYAQAQASKEKQEQLRESIIQLEAANNTFKPTLYSAKPNEDAAQDGTKGAVPPKPISERMKHYIEERNRKLEEAKRLAEAKAAAENTFRPQMQTSRPHTPTSARTESVFERLNKIASKPQSITKPEESPKSPSSASKVQPREDRDSDKDPSSSIYDRLYSQAEMRKKQLATEAEQIRLEQEKDLTFSPNVSATSQYVSKASKLEVFERLSLSRSVDTTSSVKDPEEEEFTFKPKLNSRSLSFEKKFSEPVHLRLQKYAEMHQKRIEEEKKKREEAELEGCTFEPHIPEYKSKKIEGSSENGQDGETTARSARRESREYTYGRVARSARSQSPSGASTASAHGSIITEPDSRFANRTVSPASLARARTPTKSFAAKIASNPTQSPTLRLSVSNVSDASSKSAKSPSASTGTSSPRVIRPKAAVSPNSSSDLDSQQNPVVIAASDAPAEEAESF